MTAASIPPSETLPPGTTLGRYVLGGALGAGGMGAVYEATHVELGRRVALKTLHPGIARDAQAYARFLREGRAAARIRHPHVVDVFDVGVHQGVPWLVMEHLEGEDLAARLAREGTLPVDTLTDLLLPVCAGVVAAHDAGVIHRDLKPENIFLVRPQRGPCRPKVLDFGISKIPEPGIPDSADDPQRRALTATGALLGTPCYMAPEQVRGARFADARTDQYALGVILYECATGQRPFDDEALYGLLTRIVMGECPSPQALRPDLPSDFDALIRRAMSVSPDQRFPSVLSLGAALLPHASPAVRAVWETVFAAAAANPLPAPVTPSHADNVRTRPETATTLQRGAVELPLPPRPSRDRRLTLVAVVTGALACLLVALTWPQPVARHPPASAHPPPVIATVAARIPPPVAVLPTAAPVAPFTHPTFQTVTVAPAVTHRGHGLPRHVAPRANGAPILH